MWPKRIVFVDWPIAGALAPTPSSAAPPASDILRKSRRRTTDSRFACFMTILLAASCVELQADELGQPERQRRKEHHQDHDERHPYDKRQYGDRQRLELHACDARRHEENDADG